MHCNNTLQQHTATHCNIFGAGAYAPAPPFAKSSSLLLHNSHLLFSSCYTTDTASCLLLHNSHFLSILYLAMCSRQEDVQRVSTHCNNTLQQHTATRSHVVDHIAMWLQIACLPTAPSCHEFQHTATTHYNNTLQHDPTHHLYIQ